ncbi:DUF3592 domain-containing protein [Streptomyces sp. L2]|uniref:DUF3592 domain-containing protein n=1 Tax=Streptomyces sp. L2 TaxID=2162665 RepID=UPI00101064AB|nr:DUF3592 domain-containing protein [Streptomyces sp. L2]
MELIFYVLPIFMIVGMVAMATVMLRRSQQIGRAWENGLTAQGRCLRTYTTTSGGGSTSVSTSLHHVYEFTTLDGRPVRFDEAHGPATVVEGDLVTVHYLPDHPEQATAHAPARGKLAASTGCVVAFFGVGIAFCLGFMAVVHIVFAESSSLMP